MASDADIVTAF